MADISRELNQIMKAQFGRDVRQSIHDGINALNGSAEAERRAAEKAQKASEEAQKKAEAAQKASETAKEKAETAQSASETAKERAEVSQSAAELAKEAAETAKKKAETAQAASEAAQEKAETSQSAAELAKEAAETAKEKSETAQSASETAKERAEVSQSAAELAKEVAETAKEKAETAQAASEAAQEKAEASQAAAESAKEAAETEKAESEAAQKASEAAQARAEFYAEQCRQITEGLAGAILPLGTITSEELLSLSMENVKSGYMYNISNEFTTTDAFREGAGKTIAEGSNVYMTADGKWDVLAGSPVTGVKGDKEIYYRRGNVNITPENIGALPKDGNATSATKATQDGNGKVIADTYLPKTGGEMTGALYNSTGSNDGRKTKITGGSYNVILPDGGYAGGINYFDQKENAVCSMGCLVDSGAVVKYFYAGTSYNKPDGKFKAAEFIGDLKGNADSATEVENAGVGTANTFRHVWFSDSDNEARRAYDNNFQYNPYTSTLRAFSIEGDSIYTNATEYRDAIILTESESFEIQSMANGGDVKVRLTIDADINSIYGSYMTLAQQGVDLGINNRKWNNIYANNGTIQTSDRNEKNTIADLSAEKAQALIYGFKPSTYQMNGGTSGRTHWGMISQDIEALLEELGWTTLDFAGFIKSPKMHIEEEERDEKTGKVIKERVEEVIADEYDYSLRYDEFIAPMIKVIQLQHEEIKMQNERIETLKQKIEMLEQKISVLA